jgi:hypothetical protein
LAVQQSGKQHLQCSLLALSLSSYGQWLLLWQVTGHTQLLVLGGFSWFKGLILLVMAAAV